jgi:hypothetical protein
MQSGQDALIVLVFLPLFSIEMYVVAFPEGLKISLRYVMHLGQAT